MCLRTCRSRLDLRPWPCYLDRMDLPIFVDNQGRPIGDRPIPPPLGASADEVVAYLRARAAYVDAATERSGRVFAARFRRALRG